MRILTILVATCSIILFSCQKELSVDDGGNGGPGGGGGNSSGTLLVKKVDKSGPDSLVNIYTYNSGKKLVNLKIDGVEQGSPTDREYRYYRNSSGILTQYSVIDADLVAQGIDSAIVVVHYNSSNSRYTSYVLKALGLVLDSSSFVYDGSGKIAEENLYESSTGLGNDYDFSGKVNYTYANGNVTQMDIHDFDDMGTEVFTGQSLLTYDSKINPLYFDNESFAIGHPEWASTNNVAGEQLKDLSSPADDQTVTFAYVYNTSDRPATAVITVVPDNTTFTSAYYYQ